MKRVMLVVIGLIGLVLADSARAGHESRGGDAFEIGQALKLFDVLEYSEEFMPDDLPEYVDLIKGRIEVLKSKLPRTGRFLEQIFTKGISPRWYFVEFKLKEVSDEGNSNLALSFNKIQIARNTGTVVQIQKSLWLKLEKVHRAWLLMHEALWSAVGIENVNSGEYIRRLTSLPFHKNLEKFSKQDLIKEIRASVGAEDAPILRYVRVDAGEYVGRTEDGEKPSPYTWADVSTRSDGVSPSQCVDDTDQCVFKDLRAQNLLWTERSPGKSDDGQVGGDFLDWEAAATACAELENWGGYSDWRLPTFPEMSQAVSGHDIAKIYRDGVAPAFGANNEFFWASSESSEDSTKKVTNNFETGILAPASKLAHATWRCVRWGGERNWEDISKKEDGFTETACRQNSDQCAFRDLRTKLLWSERSPGYPNDDDYRSLSDAKKDCRKPWAGYEGWRIPTSREFQKAFGLYQLSLQFEKLAYGSGKFFTSTRIHTWHEVTFDFMANSVEEPPKYQYEFSWVCVHDPNSSGDQDGDGAPDSLDKCPNTPAGAAIHTDPGSPYYGCAKGQTPTE